MMPRRVRVDRCCVGCARVERPGTRFSPMTCARPLPSLPRKYRCSVSRPGRCASATLTSEGVALRDPVAVRVREAVADSVELGVVVELPVSLLVAVAVLVSVPLAVPVLVSLLVAVEELVSLLLAVPVLVLDWD